MIRNPHRVDARVGTGDAPPSGVVDGPTLREVRLAHQVPLRRVARLATLSHGHLSKVERGEGGRPVTPRVLLAYERATGVPLTNGVPPEAVESHTSADRMSRAARRVHVAELAAVAYGQPLERTYADLLDRHREVAAGTLGRDDLAVVEAVARVLSEPDDGAAAAGSLAEAVLRWLAPALDADRGASPGAAQVAVLLALRAARGAKHGRRYAAARTLRLVALRLAVALDDPDLRSLVLVRAAAQFARAGWPEAHDLLRLADGDERVSAPVAAEIDQVRRLATCVPPSPPITSATPGATPDAPHDPHLGGWVAPGSRG